VDGALNCPNRPRKKQRISVGNWEQVNRMDDQHSFIRLPFEDGILDCPVYFVTITLQYNEGRKKEKRQND